MSSYSSNNYSEFLGPKHKIVLSAEESYLKLNQTVFFSPFCCQDMCLLALCGRMSCFFVESISFKWWVLSLSVGKFHWMASLVGTVRFSFMPVSQR